MTQHNINLSEELAEHVIWNVRLRCFLEGKECISRDEAVSDKHCKLGLWIKALSKMPYGHSRTIHDLQKTHRQLHATVRRIIRLKNEHETGLARKELTRLEILNKNIITLLNEFDEATVQKQHNALGI